MIYRRRKIGLTGDFLSVIKSVSPERGKKTKQKLPTYNFVPDKK